jgi:hypothetical protein
MKSTENFKKVISQHLEVLAKNDPIFAETLKKENKNIDDCITYILNTVQKSGSNGFEDEEIFGMAIHYYDEDSLEAGTPVNCKIVTNHKVELTAEDIQEAKQEAIKKVIAEEKERMKKKATPIKKDDQKADFQASLF